ncbi:NAD-dependent epimerase/dehydratase family protein [Rothia nasimurium]|uniref:NAD-dependent epimerase/dehydratase family protein n=1 Tax=Luteibacter anthropi TaxID=564369 RepID=A0A7X5ZKF4_9GAMM|nr:NAD-dependent epimerase/dehydratase family protein [Luteibacter anthropi]NII08947.1 NAD-dependent epimerase/dehydratase family protein [Luteibacter anthropi]
MLATRPSSGYETILVAGAGDIGLRAARQLALRGHRVYAMRRRPVPLAGDPVTWLSGDLTDPATLRRLPVVDAVIFAPAPDGRDEALYRALFVDGLRNLLKALPDPPRRTVFVSSSAVYGAQGEGWVDEDTPPDPPGFNGRVLLEAEQWLATQGIGGVAVRFAGLYGPGRTQLLDRLREGKVVVPRGQEVFANRIHVDDAAASLVHVLALDKPASLYVGVDDTPLPIDVLYDHLADLLGVPHPADGPGPAGVGSKRLSNARLRQSGFHCRWPDSREGYTSLLPPL